MTTYLCNCAYCNADLPSDEIIKAPGGDDICARCAEEKSLYVCIECRDAYEGRQEGTATEDGWVCLGCLPSTCCECGTEVHDEVMCRQCVTQDNYTSGIIKGE